MLMIKLFAKVTCPNTQIDPQELGIADLGLALLVANWEKLPAAHWSDKLRVPNFVSRAAVAVGNAAFASELPQ